MKNKFIKILFILILNLNFLELSYSKEFTFKGSVIEVKERGNIYKSAERGKIITDSQIEIISNSFEYLKKKNRVEAVGDVQIVDLKNNIKISAEKIVYFKNIEKILTVGKTTIKISNKYTVDGRDLILLRNKMILSSNNTVIINDNLLNIYKLAEFELLIKEEILKGEKIEITTNNQKANSDKFFFSTGFFNLKENKFLAKDVNMKFHKTLFNNSKNDPRINAVSIIGDENNSFFKKGVFTTCEQNEKCPPWKIRSDEIHHDKVKKQIIYKNAWLDVYDVPILYLPKFFHPDPSVKRQSGFLRPEIGSSQTLGSSVYTPYFFIVSEDKDMTIKPRFFSDNKFILQNEYRQKTKNSFTIADFSFAKGHSSNTEDKNDNRSHFFSNSKIDLDLKEFSNSVLEINYEKTSNDNYLKLFNLDSPLLFDGLDVLESKIQLNLEHQNYDFSTSFEMYETLDGANSDRYEYILPTYNFSKNFNIENLNGGLNFNSNGNNTLNLTNVVTSVVTNDLNYTSYYNYFDNGIKSNYGVYLKNINSKGKNNPKYKSTLNSELASAYIFNTSLPLTKNTKKTFNTLEPKLSIRISPNDMKNNNNLERKVDMNNIYNINRLDMNNSYEGGESLTVGFDFKKEKVTTKNKANEIEDYFEFRMATIFRNKHEKNIPITSTLNKKQSNVFGQLNYKPTKNFSLDYDFSLNNNLSTFEYNSLNAKINHNNFFTQFNLIEEKGLIGLTNVVENITKYNIDEENILSFKTRRNRNLNLTEYYDLLYQYKNDCLIAGIQYKKNYYNDADIKPVEELFFTITIVPLTTFSSDKVSLN